MSLEQEAMKNFVQEKTAEKQILEEFAGAGEPTPEPAPVDNLIKIDFSFLMKKTGQGEVENYLGHPMNPKKSKGRARFLRGCTGIAGDLDLAIIDIMLGSFEMIMEKRAGNVADQ